MRIVIADDEPLLRYHLRSILAELRPGLQIEEAENGQQLLDLILNKAVHAAFVDIRMPRMDGLEAMSRSSDLKHNIPWVILSSHSEFNYAQKALNLGALGYVLKPPSAKEIAGLMEKIETALESSREDDLKSFQYAWVSGNDQGQDNELCIIPGMIQIEGPDLQPAEEKKELSVHIQSLITEKIRGEMDEMFLGAAIPGQRPGSIFMLLATESPGTIEQIKKIQRLWNNMYTHISAHALFAGCRVLCILGTDAANFHDADMQASMLDGLVSCRALLPSGILLYEKAQELLLPLSSQDIKTARSAARLAEAAIKRDAAEYRAAEMELEKESIETAPQTCQKIQAFLNRIALQEPQEWQDNGCDHDIIHEIKAYVLRHYAEKISLSDIAVLFGLSPNYLSTLFHQKTGKTFVEYLTQLRMEKGRELLRTGKSVKECAWALGYNSERHFAQLYRKYFGLAAAEEKKAKS